MKKIFLFFFFVFISLIYIITIRGIAGNINPNLIKNKSMINSPIFETSLERGRYAQIVSLAEYKTFNVDQFYDFLRPDLAWYNGHYYPAFPSGVSFFLSPFYTLGRFLEESQVITYSGVALISILNSIVLYLICKKIKLSTGASLFSVVVLLFCSNLWAYSVTLSAHPFSSLIISLMLLISLNIKRNKNTFIHYLLLWFLYGSNFFIDYPNLFISLPILIFAIHRSLEFKIDSKKIFFNFKNYFIYGIISMFFVLSLFFSYNLAHYSKPVAFSNSYNLRALDILGVKYDNNKLNNDIFLQKKYSGRFKLESLPRGLHALLISKDRGLFLYFPIFIFSISGIFYAYKKNKNLSVAILMCFLFDLILYGAFDDPWGGWGFGPRYLIPTLPLLTIFIGHTYNKIFNLEIVRKIFLSIILLVLSMFSLGVSVIGVITSNAIPPSVEATYLGIPSNFILNIEYLKLGRISSFAYHEILNEVISPSQFYFLIYLLCFFILFAIMFYSFFFEKDYADKL